MARKHGAMMGCWRWFRRREVGGQGVELSLRAASIFIVSPGHHRQRPRAPGPLDVAGVWSADDIAHVRVVMSREYGEDIVGARGPTEHRIHHRSMPPDKLPMSTLAAPCSRRIAEYFRKAAIELDHRAKARRHWGTAKNQWKAGSRGRLRTAHCAKFPRGRMRRGAGQRAITTLPNRATLRRRTRRPLITRGQCAVCACRRTFLSACGRGERAQPFKSVQGSGGERAGCGEKQETSVTSQPNPLHLRAFRPSMSARALDMLLKITYS
jgi:hypothetical protein